MPASQDPTTLSSGSTRFMTVVPTYTATPHSPAFILLLSSTNRNGAAKSAVASRKTAPAATIPRLEPAAQPGPRTRRTNQMAT